MHTKSLASYLLFCFLILGILVGTGLAQEQVLDPSLTFSVTPLENDPATTEISIQIENLEAVEIWNVDVRLESGDLGLCPAVFQLGRIPVGGLRRIRSTCVAPDTEYAGVLIWRIDFDSETGHQRVVTAGFRDLGSAQGGQ